MSGGEIVKGPESMVESRKFQTVTGRDFGRANAWSKQRGNPVSAAIRARLPEGQWQKVSEEMAAMAAVALAHCLASEFSSPAQNLGTSATANAAQAVALTGDADAESGDASGECAGEELLSDFRSNARYLELSAKVARGESLTNNERGDRQGLIFNHGGKPSGFCVI